MGTYDSFDLFTLYQLQFYNFHYENFVYDHADYVHTNTHVDGIYDEVKKNEIMNSRQYILKVLCKKLFTLVK